MPQTKADALPATFNRLAWSNLVAQSAEQVALAAAPIVAVLLLGAGEGETGLLQTALTLPFVLFAGLDDIAFEGLTLGAKGWVSGLTNAFPLESLLLYEALVKGDLERARWIYRWFMPLLHLDAEHDLVQAIKLAETLMGRGSEWVRPPRLALAGERRAAVTAMVERARATRPR